MSAQFRRDSFFVQAVDTPTGSVTTIFRMNANEGTTLGGYVQKGEVLIKAGNCPLNSRQLPKEVRFIGIMRESSPDTPLMAVRPHGRNYVGYAENEVIFLSPETVVTAYTIRTTPALG